ncbi:histidine kinase [Streptomyces sp. NPDC000594]|uniref:sensor histidine kinase n=1 Tax=Streptomyces sp. NPDC000594 TaxID=3154261 RepID=UPI003324373F
MSTSWREVRSRPRTWTPAPGRPWTSGHPWISGGALTVCALGELVLYPGSVTVTVGVLLSAASLMWRVHFPPLAVLTVAAGLVAFAAGENLYVVTIVSGLNGLYTLGRHRVQHPVVIVVCGALGALAVNLWHIARWTRPDGLPLPELGEPGSLGLFTEAFVLTVVVIGAVSMGDAVRARAETRRERALAQARLIAMERRQAAAAERTAIARELHDIVAHSVSMIAVQAESLTYTTPELSPRARDGIQQIAVTARSSMTELRRLLGVLRTPDGPSGGAAPTAPQPGLDHLPALLDQHRAVGGDAGLTVLGDRPDLPAGWELSAYRIVQEALTNTRKHAPGARAEVEIDYGSDGSARTLTLCVRDNGPGPVATATAVPGGGHGGQGGHDGHGLTGMRERAALVGGRLTAGAGPDGGFVVRAELPW